MPSSSAPATAGSVAGGLRGLIAFFREHESRGLPLVLATVVGTSGTTYRKRGAQMLIRSDEEWHGLLSGGCLEGDLAAHAQEVFSSGRPRMVDYALAAMTDALWGFGLGCDGSVSILLQRLDADNAWEPFASVSRLVEQGDAGRLILLCESDDASVSAGHWALKPASGEISGPLARLPFAVNESPADPATDCRLALGGHVYAGVSLPLPRVCRLVVLGAGPDAVPLTQFAAQLGWHVTLADHRASYASAARFPSADRVLCVPDQRLPGDLGLGAADAVVIMSHNLAADERYFAQAVASSVPYIGLLGPKARKDKLVASLADGAQAGRRVHGPVGLDLGGEGPEAIALSIVAEIQATMHGKPGGGRTDR